MNTITIKGARENNLKNIDLVIPRNKIVCFVGVSGSGKSTIAFDIIAREGQRQYFESLSSYARRYLTKSNQPDVDQIEGISSTIIIDQERVRNNPRSTVGTLSEAYTHLRMLFSRVGVPIYDSSFFSFNHPHGACTTCKGLGRSIAVNLDKVVDRTKSLNQGALQPSEWYVGGRQWHIVKATGYFDMDKKVKDYSPEELDKLLYEPPILLESGGEFMPNRWTYQGIVHRMMHRNTKVHRGPSESDLAYFDFVNCPSCHGGRLNEDALSVTINGKTIGQVATLPITQCLAFVKEITHPHAAVIRPLLIESLESLIHVGVGYLTLNRSADTLSGGEAQRVKFARQLGSNLVETIYVLDEPTAGLHPKDIDTITNNLTKLKEKGNTVIVVEHDETVIQHAEYVVEVGPGGGSKGGEIVFCGEVSDLIRTPHSLTSRYLGKQLRKEHPPRTPTGKLLIQHATRHNLKNITVTIPTGVLVALTGVSGSGKSSLVEEIVSQYREKIVLVDQEGVGNNKRGCIATYTGAFDQMRKLFAKEHGMSESFFSFNAQGACQQCNGLGFLDMDMNFLGDVKVRCEACGGSRYKEKVLQYLYRGKTIADVLHMSAHDVKEFFAHSDIQQKMDMLIDVGLEYVEMGQTLDTLSGGESQRLKLASRLTASGEFYILDEPTSGLHFADIEKLMHLLNKLVDQGNTVLVVEHNIPVIRQADWVIDLGPEGGDRGGTIVAQGKPEDLMHDKRSITGKYLL